MFKWILAWMRRRAQEEAMRIRAVRAEIAADKAAMAAATRPPSARRAV